VQATKRKKLKVADTSSDVGAREIACGGGGEDAAAAGVVAMGDVLELPTEEQKKRLEEEQELEQETAGSEGQAGVFQVDLHRRLFEEPPPPPPPPQSWLMVYV
jgi:hypothetical protein